MTLQASCRSSLWYVFLCCLVLFFTGQQVSAQVENEKRSFDVSEGYAINTLKEAVQQADVEFIFSADLVKGVRTPSVQGEYTPLEAFSLMLVETSLEVFQHRKSGVYAITKVSEIPTLESEQQTKKETEMNTKNSNWLKTLAAILAVGIPNGRSALTAQENSDDIVNLTPFIVSSSNDEIYSTQQSNTGTIFAINRELIPFVTSVVTEEMIEDMALDNPADLSEQMAGVSKDSNPLIADEGGQTSLTFRVRGFTSEPLYNGFQTGGISHGTDNVGRVEVSKGANSVLYGQSPAGGVINLVPKAPQFTDHSRLTVGAGSNDSTRVIFEMGGPTASENTGKASAYRFGGSHQEFEREQIFFHAQLQTFWGAHTWQFNENVTLELQTEILEFENTPSRTPAFVSTGSGPDRVVDPFNRLRNDRNFSYNGPHILKTGTNFRFENI
jgi:iron complex outermembrane recepter protein